MPVYFQVSPIDPSSEEGEKPARVTGNIEFQDINFVYPSREDVKVPVTNRIVDTRKFSYLKDKRMFLSGKTKFFMVFDWF